MKQSKKNILFLIIMILMLLPFLQHLTGIFEVRPLKGSFQEKSLPEFSFQNYYQDEFQTDFNTWLEQHIGFRPIFIRVNNQLAYSLYDTVYAKSVIIGKANYLYEANYIKAYTGTDFTGKENIEEKINKLQFIQQEFLKDSTHLIVILAPGKATYFPEYIPDHYLKDQQENTNYQYWRNELLKENINLIDFNDFFKDAKDTSRYPLYPQYGIHWSTYGAHLAFDSILSFMENILQKDIPDMQWNEIVVTAELRDTDYDIGEGLNLLFELPTYKMAYPKIKIETEGKYKPDVITIADSYYWNLFGKGLTAVAFDNNSFWYYFQQAYNPQYDQSKPVNDLDLLEELYNQDFIILLATDANLYKFAFGFIDSTYKHLQNRKEDI